MKQELDLMKKIEERGLIGEFKKHNSYFHSLYKKGIISKEELLKSHDSSLTSLGGEIN
jgi:hypothetical protein